MITGHGTNKIHKRGNDLILSYVAFPSFQFFNQFDNREGLLISEEQYKAIEKVHVHRSYNGPAIINNTIEAVLDSYLYTNNWYNHKEDIHTFIQTCPQCRYLHLKEMKENFTCLELLQTNYTLQELALVYHPHGTLRILNIEQFKMNKFNITMSLL